MKWAKRPLCMALAAGTLLLCACAGSGTGASASSSATRTPAAGGTASATQTEAVPQSGGELFIAMPESIGSFDPLTQTDEDMINLLSLVYDAPVILGADGKPQAGLAESWEVDETGTVYTFHFRQNIVFQDGETPFGVDDVIYSMDRVFALDGTQVPFSDLTVQPEPTQSGDPTGEEDTQEPSEGAQQPEESSTEGSLGSSSSPEGSGSPESSGSPSPGASETVELPESNRYAQYNSLVSEVAKVDANTLRLTMTKPGMEALYFMHFPVVSQTLFAANELPVGTGAYRIDGYEDNAQMTLTENEAWWNSKPYIPKIVAKAFTGSAQKIDAVETSVLDFITTNVLYAGNYKLAGKTQVVDYMTNYYDCLLPNLSSNTLGDINVRQAITYAIDRREIISTVLLNHAVPANMPIAPDFYAYDSRYKQDDDLTTAREFLRAAGYRTDEESEGNTLEVQLMVPVSRTLSYRTEAAKAIKKQLEKIGISVTIEELEETEYYANLQSGNYDLAYCSYYLDENPDLGFLFNPGGSGNYNAVNSQEITDAIAACNSAFTEDGVKAAYSELQRLLLERLPQIGLYYRMNSIICDEAIQNIIEPRQNMVFGHINEWYIGQDYS